jgi:predicted hotdog family 3-hydroxylacyl-ACP dehydratase
MELDKIDIHELLPQQEPFVMVGELIHYDDVVTVTATKISDENIFVESGVFTPSGVIENIAQTCAARIGYINKYILKKGIQIGFIGAVRDLNLYRLPKTGEEITTTISVIEEVFGMTLVSASVKIGDEVLADAEMKIAVRDER